MRFTKYLGLGMATLLAACGSPPAPGPASSPAPAPSPASATTGSGPAVAAPRPPAAAPLAPARNWDEYKQRAARRIMQTSAGETFSGPTGDHMRSIPVLQVQLNRDGSVRNIVTLRTPKFSPQTLQMAIRAIQRAAPFEPVGHLPQPWQYSETFLYNDDLKFQLRSLAETQ
ncbi:MAG: hypothetical protein U1E71_04205 [Ramlibacter sp.]